MRRTNHLETIWNDLRYAVRTLGRTPGFAVIIVLTLALSIGANSAIFSVDSEACCFGRFPFAHADRLVRIYFASDTQPKFPLNPNDFRDFRERNRTFESMAAITRHDLQLSGIAGDPVLLRGFRVTAATSARSGCIRRAGAISRSTTNFRPAATWRFSATAFGATASRRTQTSSAAKLR